MSGSQRGGKHWGRIGAAARRGGRAGRGLTALVALAVALGVAPAASAAIVDVNPNQSTLDPSDPDGASGGRLNGLATVAGDNDVFYGASEWGGLWKSTDAGLTWSRLNGHVANAAWDVEVDPGTPSRVYATSFFDGRAAGAGGPTTRAGINVSNDSGATWTRPATATAPPNSGTFTCAAARRNEPSAFGISIQPDAPQNVYIGTNCGLAISNDSGATWTYVDPTPATAASNVWDVVVQAGGIIDVCGDDGHLRSTDNGATWTASTGLVTGRCSIAASPDESYVLFVAAADNNVYETDDADAATPTWTNRGTPDFRRQGRIPFVATNQRSDSGGANVFDLWFSDVSLFRAGCTTPATRPNPDTGGSPRCPAGRLGPAASPPPAGWAGPFTRSTGAHDDAGDIVFDTEAANDACPELYSSDGGVYYNTDNGSDCQNPNWEQPNVTPHALWVYAMDGADQPGDAAEDLYFGNQDNGSFATQNAGAGSPTWVNRDCCDVFDIVADPTRVVYTLCCGFSLRFAGPGLTGVTNVATQPPGCCPTFNFPDFVDRFADNSYVAVTNQGAFITTAFTASPTVWTQLGAASTPGGGFCGVQAAVTGGTPTFYAQTQCAAGEGGGASQLWSYTGTAPGGAWQRIDTNDGLTGGFTVWAVDPNDPNRLYAANNAPGGMQMVFSTDGGANWDTDPELDAMMTGNGAFLYRTQRGPTSFTGFGGYSQPSLLAYDPEDSDIIVAGGRDSGVFLSTDAGANWSLLTDPFTPDTSGREHLPRPMFAYFDHEPAPTTSVYVGTQGRGVWRISFQIPTADAGGPYTTPEGTDVALTASGADPDGQPLTFAWDLDADGQFDDGSTATVTFTDVGQDGVFPVSVKVTDSDGAFDVATTDVEVTNVAPSVVGLASDAPVDENAAVTVTGSITDPGWLEALTGTVDWGDGTPVESLTGTLENVRPDATLAFTASHVYGDDGTFTATVCGFDDDTSACDTIALQVDNVDPSAEIDESGATLVNGVPTFITHAGDPVDFAGRSQDPGSDDLHLSWDWDDGPPAPDVTTTYLNDPAFDPDPDPSPTIGPRDVTDMQTHVFADACLYAIVFAALDDDAGSGLDTANVIVAGNADELRSAGYWQNQYRAGFPNALDDAVLECYLAIAGYMSQVFHEVRDASTIPLAFDVLKLPSAGTNAERQFDRQLLALWLNFANGAIEYGELVDTDGDGVDDTAFSVVVDTAEAVRLDPTSTTTEIEAQKAILERINVGKA